MRRCRSTHRTVTFWIILASAILTSAAVIPAYAVDQESVNTKDEKPDQSTEADDENDIPHRYAIIRGGYRFVTTVDTAAAAAPYTRLDSGVMGGISAGTVGSDLKLSVAATVINEDDYHAELSFDQGGIYRLHLESQALWHNLLVEQLPSIATGTITSKDLHPGSTYGTRTEINQFDGLLRLGDNPFHLALGYWQLTNEGVQQTRFSDYYFGNAASSILTTSSVKNQTTREGKVGLDGQLGVLGLAYLFTIRDFSNDAPVNRYGFANTAFGALSPGNQAFNVVPDSQVVSHSFKLYSDLSGGLVGTAAYVFTQRENNGGKGDATPSSHPKDTIQSLAGDLSYTPVKQLSFAFKYRRQQIDRETPASVSYPFSTIPAPNSAAGSIPGVYTGQPGILLVRPASDMISDTLLLSATYRPVVAANLRLEYRANLESRSGVAYESLPGEPTSLYNDKRQTHAGKISASWRPVNGVKLNAFYGYEDCDNPATAASFSTRQTGQMLASFTPGRRWGMTASYLGRFERIDAGEVSGTGATSGRRLPRSNHANSVNTSVWISPLDRLTLTGSYSFFTSDIDQTVLFSSLSPLSQTTSNYLSSAHVYAVDAVYAYSEKLDLLLSFQQIFSASRFSPGAVAFTNPSNNTSYSTAGINELSRLDATEVGLSARADWRFSDTYGCSLDYGFRRYDAGNQLFDGMVHSTMISFTGRW